MPIHLKTSLLLVAIAATLLGCAEPETPAPAPTEDVARPATQPMDVFGSSSNNRPPPAEEVFFPDLFAEADGSITLGFRMLPGYYLYKDKIGVRSLTENVAIAAPDLPQGEIIVDDWFGEQQVYFNDMMANASVINDRDGAVSVDVEVSWQGCKKDELCYMPVSKVITVQLAAPVESAAD